MWSKILSIAIALMGIIYIFLIPHDPVGLKITFKLIPMLLIILFAFHQAPGLPKIYKTLIILGLFVCMLADGLIYWFIVGLITFLIGHIIYIFAFRKIKKHSIPKWAAALLLIYGLIMTIWLAGTLWSEKETILAVAVVLYIAVILTMGWNAFQTGNKFVIIGATLFIFSDSILAINKFIIDVPYEHALVMLSYYGAQFLFAFSIISHYSATRNNLLK
ncbi:MULTISPECIES: lysoplasmalogenase [Psychrobacillus]|uniref:Lysoplasmalogenase n=1 Tax=Psychrobacillus faecigallinarum TaxID=2762235 RepID=A0ABR8RAE9_9BACI|nr:lysoplasmalogenase [Psychrobacillus faecigallinarum]MBD7944777.1 lysoplasmalogenase [Psychrobacillus faecigallinarum]